MTIVDPTPATHPAPTTAPDVRRHSPGAEPMPGPAALLSRQILAEVRQCVRVPEYVVGVVAVPAILYAMFGLSTAGIRLPGGVDVAAVMVGSFGAYGIVSLAIFTFGVDIAAERGKGWLRRLRATPMPMWAYFAAKIVTGVAFSALVLALLTGVALLGGVRIDWARMAPTFAVLLGGAVVFAPVGFSLAYWFRPRAASAIGNLVFLPLSFLSGFFYPLTRLPEVFQDLAPWLPTYHFGQLVWGGLATPGDIVAFGNPAPEGTSVHLAWVCGTFLAFAALAAWGYRRDARRERA